MCGAEVGTRPLVQCGPVQTDLAAQPAAIPDHGAREGRLAGSARADDPDRLPGEQGEADVRTTSRGRSRRRDGDALDGQRRWARAAPCGSVSAGRRASSSCNRPPALAGRMKPFQLAMASSTGASARETRIELAIMIPAVAWPLITRQAPRPRIAD